MRAKKTPQSRTALPPELQIGRIYHAQSGNEVDDVFVGTTNATSASDALISE
ncbi:hypothetical protein ACFXG4_07710 [Nocardia sp. NPDC059246]|uniref:hypothetical protein n=1 Tax=unclassified Nocardia TaxID=2637762 RepID=UPI00367475C0